MAGYEGNLGFSGNMKPFLFSRSMTMHSSPLDPPQKPSLDRSQSTHKFSSLSESRVPSSSSFKGKVKQLCSLFESTKAHKSPPLKSKLSKFSGTDSTVLSSSSIRLPGADDRIVVYFTSLGGIRRTFEDCYAVRMIFRGFRVWVDERDISMDSEYRKELQGVLGEKKVSLPQVFIKGKYVGGAEVIKQLYEVGELGKLLDGIPVRQPGYVCQSCGDARFIPCTNCNGSRKVYEEDEGVLRRCLECNENGLIRCPTCCS